MKRYLIIALIFLATCATIIYAQKKKTQTTNPTQRKELKSTEQKTGKKRLDSLLTEYDKWTKGKNITPGRELIPAISDTNYILLLSDIGFEYRTIDSINSYNFINSALGLSQELGYTKGIASAYRNFGNLYSINQIDIGLEYHEKALSEYEKINDLDGISASFYNIGLNYSKVRMDSIAIIYFDKALEIFDRINPPAHRYHNTIRNKLTSLYRLRNIHEGIKTAQYAMKKAEELGSAELYFEGLYDLKVTFSNEQNMNKKVQNLEELLQFTREKNLKQKELNLLTYITELCFENLDLEKALNYNNSALSMALELNNESELPSIYLFRGAILLRKKEYDEAEKNFNLSAELYKKRNLGMYISTLLRIAYNYSLVAMYNKAIQINEFTIQEIQRLNYDYVYIDYVYRNLSSYYESTGKYNEALENAFKAFDYSSLINDTIRIADSYIGIASIYLSSGDHTKALEYYNKSLELYKKKNQLKGIGISSMEIARIYFSNKEYDKAEKLAKEGMIYFKQLNLQDYISRCLLFLLNIEMKKSKEPDYAKAINLIKENLIFFESINDRLIIAELNSNLGIYYYHLANKYENDTTGLRNSYLDSALNYKLLSLNQYREIGDLKVIQENLEDLSNFYHYLNDDKKSLEYYKEYITMKDSLDNIENLKVLAELKSTRELEMKEKENELLRQKSKLDENELIRQRQALALTNKEKEVQALALANATAEKLDREQKLILAQQDKLIQDNLLSALERDKALKDAQIKAKDMQRNFYIMGIALLLLLFFIILLRSRERKKLIDKLKLQNEEIENQKSLLQYKNNQIYASIRYASTIQHAILPWGATLSKAFREHFIFFKPKDIVSGDSYWFQEIDGIKFLAVIDCTGHGIPGSMLTVIASSVLDDAVLGRRLRDAGEILTFMNEKVTEVLNQRLKENEVRDGMEVALVAIHPDKLEYSGAGRPLYIRNGKFDILKTERREIAGSTNDYNFRYLSQTIVRNGDMTLYLTTDGFPDQMNEDGKKYSTKRFVSLLESISEKPIPEQNIILETEFNSHKGSREQIDDVTVIGVRL